MQPNSPYCPQCGQAVAGADDAPQPMGEDPIARALLPVGRSGWAIAAGYAGLFGLLVFPAPLALLLGIVGAMHLRSNPKLHGWGRVGLALVVGAVGTTILLITLFQMSEGISR